VIFTPFDCTLEEAKAGIARTQSREKLYGKVASREIRDCFKVSRFGK
jgi:hypothetical protein